MKTFGRLGFPDHVEELTANVCCSVIHALTQ